MTSKPNIGICDQSSIPEDDFTNLCNQIPLYLHDVANLIFLPHSAENKILLDVSISIFDESKVKKKACEFFPGVMMSYVYWKTCKEMGFSLLAVVCMQIEAALKSLQKICNTCGVANSFLDKNGDCAECVQERVERQSLEEI